MSDSYWCQKHPLAPATRICVQCGDEHCDECVVYPFGPAKGAVCIGCALSMAGVRAGTKRRRPKRELRKLIREREPVLEQRRRSIADQDPLGDIVPDPEPAEESHYAAGEMAFEGGWFQRY